MRWPAAASKLNVTLQREASLKVVVDRALRASRVLSNPSPMRLVYPCLSDASSYRSAMVYRANDSPGRYRSQILSVSCTVEEMDREASRSDMKTS